MLVLTRKEREIIHVGPDVEVHVVAPRDTPVFRREVWLTMRVEGAKGGEVKP